MKCLITMRIGFLASFLQTFIVYISICTKDCCCQLENVNILGLASLFLYNIYYLCKLNGCKGRVVLYGHRFSV